MLRNCNQDRRRFGRRRLIQHAWVRVDRKPPVACVIANISRQGALLEFHGPPPLANRFRLFLDDSDFEVDCDVRHRRNRAIGVFLTQPARPLSRLTNQTGSQLVQAMRAKAFEAGRSGAPARN